MTSIRGILFDVDGTLVDSNDLHAKAFVLAFEEAGEKIAFDKVKKLIGKGADKLIPEALGREVSEKEQEKLGDRKKEIFLERFLPEVKAFRGVKELFATLDRSGLKIAIATSAGKDEAKKLLAVAGVERFVDEKTNSDDADESKPAPDILEAALEKLGLPPEETVMLGDTPYDVEAARRAGVVAFAVRCGGWDDRALSGAAARFDGPWDPALVDMLLSMRKR